MRNTAILIDTNILLNYLTNRGDPYLEQSAEIVRKCANGECTGYIAFHTVSTLWYVLRETLIKAFPPSDLRCEAAFSLANPCDPPEVAKEMLI